MLPAYRLHFNWCAISEGGAEHFKRWPDHNKYCRKYTNIQIHTYTNSQINKYCTNIAISERDAEQCSGSTSNAGRITTNISTNIATNTQMYKYTNTQIHKFTNIQILQFQRGMPSTSNAGRIRTNIASFAKISPVAK